MSPRPKHIPDEAYRTTIRLTGDEQLAINFLKTARRQKGNDRKTLNDILVDGMWLLLEKEEARSKQEIRSMMPLPPMKPGQANVREMPKSRKRP